MFSRTDREKFPTQRMIRKKPAPHLMRGVQRFSEKIMRKPQT
jgi:hypothetical protein